MISYDFLKETTKMELRNSRYEQNKIKFKSKYTQILNCQKHVQVRLLDRWDRSECFGVGFVEFGQTSKKLRGFKDQGLISKKYIHGWVPGRN